MTKKTIDKQIIYHFDTDKPVIIPDEYVVKDKTGLWVSNVLNIDLPILEGDGKNYIDKIDELLHVCKQNNINVLYFQVRTTNDAFYQSSINPWSRYLTKQEGKEPPFDVFEYVLDKCHQQHIEVHAWCNPYRISANGNLSIDEYLDTCDDLNFAKQHKDTIVLDEKGKLIFNPADPKVKQHIIASMVELCENYDIDGIHFDDYFYPYAPLSKERNDLAFYEKRLDKTETLGDFRRRQVNELIEGVYKAIKKVNPAILFGISPFGIWKNKFNDPLGSNTSKQCSESYYKLYADSVLWVNKGWVDYIVPQLYFPFGHPIAPFADLVDFWVKVVKDTKVDLYIGHGAYQIGTKDEWQNDDEMIDQLYYANQFKEVQGNIFFTYHNFLDTNNSGIQKISLFLKQKGVKS
jgi:uncharacterized lipoprotein YddW (UPF0748 family)